MQTADLPIPKKERYTYEDYAQLPESAPYQLIDSAQKIEGAPNLIVEILSPSTAHFDLTKKKRLYKTHGVQEYWIVDPEQQTVEVFENTDDGFTQYARVVESGTAASTLLDGLITDLDDLF